MPAGQSATHLFEVTNATGEELAIRKDEDIQKNCGCTSLEPFKRSLAPGEKVTVKVDLQTGPVAGSLEKGGQIIWTAPSGKRRTVEFTVAAQVVPAVLCEPEFLVFDAEDIKAGRSKEIKFRKNLPVEWQTLRVWSTSQYFRVEETRLGEDTAVAKVVCVPPDDAEDLEDKVFAQVAHAQDATGGEERLATATVRVFAKQPMELTITPKRLLIAVDDQTGKGSARLMLRGDRLGAQPGIIEAITSEGYQVKWTVHPPTPTKTAVVEVEMDRPDKRPFDQGGFLEIRVVGLGVRRVPFVVTWSSQHQG